MKYYTIFNSSTGQIHSSGNCLDDDFVLQVIPDGHQIIELQSNPSSQYIQNNQAVNIPPKPGDKYTFNFVTKSWNPPTNDVLIQEILRTRNLLLLESDWTQLPDVPQQTSDKWKAYRQALRDITNQTDLLKITWPIKPE